jgi:ribose transport system substrate-binding protein
MKLHKIIAAAAVVPVFALCLAACGSTSETSSSGQAGATSSTSTAGNTSPQYTAADVKGGIAVKATPGGKPLHLAWFGFCSCNSYSQSEAQGLQTYLKKLNDGSTFTSFDGNFSATTQVSQIEDAITSQKYNAFVVGPIDGASVVPAVKQAVAAGIKVGAIGYPVGPSFTITDRPQLPGVVMSLVNNPIPDGTVTASRVNALCAGINPCNVVVLTGVRTEAAEGIRYNAVKQTLKPNVKIVSTCDGNFTEAGGLTCMQNALQITRHINVVMTPSGDQMLSGAQQALGAEGIKIGDQNSQGLFKFVGTGADQQAVNEIRAGLWDSSRVYLGDPTLSSIMIQALYANVNGHGAEFPQAFNTDAISPIGPIADKQTLAKDPSFTGEWSN